MEAQQIRLNINELVNGIQDEAFLNACYEAVAGIVKAYRQINGRPNGASLEQKAAAKSALVKEVPPPVVPEQPAVLTAIEAEKPMPHDLSLVFLANELFKGSEPAPPEASIAFRQALLDSATKTPTLPNRR